MESTNLNLIDGIYSALWEAPNSKPSNDVIVFVHGGPGSNSSYFEKALQEIPSFLNGRFGWLTFDQRGCGRSNSFSDSSITHEKNMEDLKGLLDALEVRNYNSITVYGHSYGARLGFDTFRAFPEIKSKLVMGGRAVFRKDSVSYMLLMHYLIIKHYYPHLAEAAHEIVAGSDPSSMNKSLKELKRLFPSEAERNERRMDFYWANSAKMQWYQNIVEQVEFEDSDFVYDLIVDSIQKNPPECLEFHPKYLRQDSILIRGFFDFIMAGPSSQGLSDKESRLFMGSGHFPHLEQPDLFVETIESFIRAEP